MQGGLHAREAERRTLKPGRGVEQNNASFAKFLQRDTCGMICLMCFNAEWASSQRSRETNLELNPGRGDEQNNASFAKSLQSDACGMICVMRWGLGRDTRRTGHLLLGILKHVRFGGRRPTGKAAHYVCLDTSAAQLSRKHSPRSDMAA